MSLPQPKIPFGPDDYLAWEQDQSLRNEYVDGEVFAMSGASDAHATVAGNLFANLHGLLRGTACKPFMADMKVHVEAANCFFYPDILVTCDPRDRGPEASHVKQHPALIVEVLTDNRTELVMFITPRVVANEVDYEGVILDLRRKIRASLDDALAEIERAFP